MYLRKNTASQTVCVGLVNATTGAALTGATVSVRRCIDGTFAATTGSVTEDTGLGFYKFAPSQADTNGDQISYFFTATNAIPVTLNVRTTAADMSDSVRFGLTALPNAAAGASGGLPTGNASGHVTLADSSLVTAKLGTFVLAKTTNITGFNDIAATAVVSGGAITTSGGAVSTVTSVTNRVTANADQFGGATVTATTSVTFPSTCTVATTTGAVGSVTGNVGGNVGGNVVGSVGSVTGAVGSVTARVTANTDQLAGQTVTAAAGVTFPTSVASPTNITAGTITTVTNLTNLPSIPANWLTAAGTAADFGAEIADAVWDEALSGHLTAGSTGEALNAAGAAGDPWTTTLPGSYTGSQAGKMLSDILTDTAEIGAAGAGLTNINLPDQAMNITGNITGNLSGSVGSVTGAVGSISGVTFPTNFAATVISAGGVVAADAQAVGGNTGTPAQLATLAQNYEDDEFDVRNVDGKVLGGGVAGIAGVGAWVAGAAGAAVSTLDAAGVRTAVGLASANLDTQLGDLPTNAELATALAAADDAVLAAVATVDTVVDAVKAKTDQLTFTVAGQVDANAESINATAVVGAGTSGNKWRA